MDLVHVECPSEEDTTWEWFYGIYEEWEKEKGLRQLALKGQGIMQGVRRKVDQVEVCVGTLRCAARNSFIIKTVTQRMVQHGVVKCPPLGRLFGQMLAFHQQNGPLTDQNILAVAHSDAWGLKRLMSFCRRKWARDETPRVACLHQLFSHGIFF